MITSSPVLQRLTSNSTIAAPRATAFVNATTVFSGLPPPFPRCAHTPRDGIGGASDVRKSFRVSAFAGKTHAPARTAASASCAFMGAIISKVFDRLQQTVV